MYTNCVATIENKFNKILTKIGKNLKIFRNKRGLSQSDMQEFGFELRNYQRIESGKHSPSLFTLHRLAEALDCEISDLLK